MRTQCIAFFFSGALLLFSVRAQAQETQPTTPPAAKPIAPQDAKPITLQEALAMALAQQPSLQEARAQVELASAQKAKIEVVKRPQVNLSTSAGLASPRGNDTTFINPGYSASVDLRWLLYDFGKTDAQLSAASASVDAAQRGINNATAQISFGVAQAYYGLWVAQESVLLTDEALTEAEARVKTAQALFESGARPKTEVSRANVDRSNAYLDQVRAQGQVRQARIALNTAIGVVGVSFSAATPPSMPAPMDLATAESLAYQQRPEVAALEAQRLAQERQVNVASLGKRPDLEGSSSLSAQGPVRAGDVFKPIVPSLSAEVVLSVPLFDGGAAAADEAVARAQLHNIDAQLDLLKLNISSDVEDAYVSYQAATAARIASEEATRFAKENADLAQGRYEAGAGSAIEISDAEVALVQARSFELQARADEDLARLKIELALGGLTAPGR